MTDAEQIAELTRQVADLQAKLTVQSWLAPIVAGLSFAFTIFVWYRSHLSGKKSLAEARLANDTSKASLAEAKVANDTSKAALEVSKESTAIALKNCSIGEQSILLTQGQVELGLQTAINDAWNAVQEIQTRMREFLGGRVGKIPIADQRQMESMEKEFLAKLQLWITQYDLACGQYIDNKVDKVRFKKVFGRRLRELVESTDEDTKKTLQPGVAPIYNSLMAVYHEWYPPNP